MAICVWYYCTCSWTNPKFQWKLPVKREPTNEHDPLEVVVVKNGEVVGLNWYQEWWVKLFPTFLDMMATLCFVRSQVKGWTMEFDLDRMFHKLKKLPLVTDHWLHTMYCGHSTWCCNIQFAVFGTGINGRITPYAGDRFSKKITYRQYGLVIRDFYKLTAMCRWPPYSSDY